MWLCWLPRKRDTYPDLPVGIIPAGTSPFFMHYVKSKPPLCTFLVWCGFQIHTCLPGLPEVGKYLKDHLFPTFSTRPGVTTCFRRFLIELLGQTEMTPHTQKLSSSPSGVQTWHQQSTKAQMLEPSTLNISVHHPRLLRARSSLALTRHTYPESTKLL